jgi:hypothetical protein
VTLYRRRVTITLAAFREPTILHMEEHRCLASRTRFAGAVHTALGLIAICLVWRSSDGKGDGAPRQVIVLTMLGSTARRSCSTVSGDAGPFHTLAVVNLITIAVGMLAVWLQRAGGWRCTAAALAGPTPGSGRSSRRSGRGFRASGSCRA